jgi:hypothetical protein
MCALKRISYIEIPNINRGILAAIDESAPQAFMRGPQAFGAGERISPPFYLIICRLNAEKRVDSHLYQPARSTVLESFYQL